MTACRPSLLTSFPPAGAAADAGSGAAASAWRRAMPQPGMRHPTWRRLVTGLLASVLAAGTAAVTAQTAAARNLLVEVRQGVDASGSRSGVDADGRVVIQGGSAGTDVRGGVLLHSLPGEGSLQRATTQQVRVLNGERASVRLSQTAPYTFYRVLWTPDGAVIAPATVWQENNQGIVVQPRWTGGDAPVEITLSAQTVATVSSMTRAERLILQHQGQNPQGATTLRTLTTVEVPLGEWVTVAESGTEQTTSTRNTWSTQEARSSERYVVQLRITAP